jgi:hypothetical protein
MDTQCFGLVFRRFSDLRGGGGVFLGLVLRDATVDDSTSISWELMYKISCTWVDVIFYVILFGVVYLS